MLATSATPAWINFAKPLTSHSGSGRSCDIDVRLRFGLGRRGRRFLHDRRVAFFFLRGRIDRRLFLAGCKERNATQNPNVFLHTSESNLEGRLVVISMGPKAMKQGSRICSAEPTGLEPATSAVTGRRSNQLS
jgi:hypothetical protein